MADAQILEADCAIVRRRKRDSPFSPDRRTASVGERLCLVRQHLIQGESSVKNQTSYLHVENIALLSTSTDAKYGIMPTTRSSNKLDRLDMIRTVADQIGALPGGHKVDLQNQERTVMIELYKVTADHCGFLYKLITRVGWG